MWGEVGGRGGLKPCVAQRELDTVSEATPPFMSMEAAQRRMKPKKV